jgi:hypothetical protein
MANWQAVAKDRFLVRYRENFFIKNLTNAAQQKRADEAFHKEKIEIEEVLPLANATIILGKRDTKPILVWIFPYARKNYEELQNKAIDKKGNVVEMKGWTYNNADALQSAQEFILEDFI